MAREQRDDTAGALVLGKDIYTQLQIYMRMVFVPVYKGYFRYCGESSLLCIHV